MENETLTDEELVRAFYSHRPRLLAVLMRRMPPVLLSRVDYEDVLQDCFVAARKRRAYFAANPEVPTYFKFRTVLLQTVADLERKHLKAESRNARCDVEIEEADDVAADVTSPLSRVDRDERHRVVAAAAERCRACDVFVVQGNVDVAVGISVHAGLYERRE